MATFLTGSTGYLGSYLAAGLLTGHRERLNLLVRAKSSQEARERLWQSLQLHLEFSEFIEYVNSRTRIFLGDLTSERFGLSDDEYHALVDTTDSIVHCRVAKSQIGETVPQREFAGFARGNPTGPAGAKSQWLAAVLARFHGGGCGETAG